MKKEIKAIYPTSFRQRGILYESLAAPDSGYHLEQSVFDWLGPFCSSSFSLCWREITNRFSVLRTVFVWRSQKEPLQILLGGVEANPVLADLSGLEDGARTQQIGILAGKELSRGFELNKKPPFRVLALRLGRHRVRVVLTFHHILLDGWSLSLLLGQWFELYAAVIAGKAFPSPSPASDSEPYSRWLLGQDLEKARCFWESYLETPINRRPPRVLDPNTRPEFARKTKRLSWEVSESLRALAKRQSWPVNTLFQGAWALIANRRIGGRDIIFGVTVSGRNAAIPHIESMVGLFINTLPLRVRIDPSRRLLDWLADTYKRSVQIQDYDFCSLAMIQEWSAHGPDAPLFDSLLVFENFPLSKPSAQCKALGLQIEGRGGAGARTRNDLVVLVEPGARIKLDLVYDQRVCSAARAETILADLAELLAIFPDKADMPLASIIRPAYPAEPERTFSATAVHAPVRLSRTQAVLAELWRNLLGNKNIGMDEPFFSLGGHSLLAARLVAGMSDRFQRRLQLHQLLECPTIRQIAELLDKTTESFEETPVATPDPDALYQPFPLTDIQYAYWVGRGADFEMGGVSTHAYFELDCPKLDLARLARAWSRVIQRHPMLRAVVLPNGEQQVLKRVPAYQIEYCSFNERDAANGLAEIRERMSHHTFDPATWPLFELRATDHGRNTTRLHLGFDLLITDAVGFSILADDWMRFYREPTVVLPQIEISFRDYVLAERAQRDSRAYRAARQYWLARLAELPAAPDLPLARNPSAIKRPRFVRRNAEFEPESWNALKVRCQKLGVSPAAFLLAVFGEVLAVWSRTPRFCLNLTVFNRRPWHPHVNKIVGDFTTVIPLAVAPGPTLAESALSVQRQIWRDLDHSLFSGVEVMREWARSSGIKGAPLLPVVFTSVLETADVTPVKRLFDGAPVFASGQTSQVWLDHQVQETNGALMVAWDTVEDLFPPKMVDAMFASFLSLLRHMSGSSRAWRAPWPALTAFGESVRRNSPPDGLLHDGVRIHAQTKPDRIALVHGQSFLSYAAMAATSSRVKAMLRQKGLETGRFGRGAYGKNACRDLWDSRRA